MYAVHLVKFNTFKIHLNILQYMPRFPKGLFRLDFSTKRLRGFLISSVCASYSMVPDLLSDQDTLHEVFVPHFLQLLNGDSLPTGIFVSHSSSLLILRLLSYTTSPILLSKAGFGNVSTLTQRTLK